MQKVKYLFVIPALLIYLSACVSNGDNHETTLAEQLKEESVKKEEIIKAQPSGNKTITEKEVKKAPEEQKNTRKPDTDRSSSTKTNTSSTQPKTNNKQTSQKSNTDKTNTKKNTSTSKNTNTSNTSNTSVSSGKKLSTDLIFNDKTASSQNKTQNASRPILAFDYKEYDFGNIYEGDTVIHKFFFVNKGTAPAIISEAESSCGCTVPEYPKDPIMPGQRAYVKAVFNSKGRFNKQRKSITIKANTQPNYTTLYLSGDVYNPPKKKEEEEDEKDKKESDEKDEKKTNTSQPDSKELTDSAKAALKKAEEKAKEEVKKKTSINPARPGANKENKKKK